MIKTKFWKCVYISCLVLCSSGSEGIFQNVSISKLMSAYSYMQYAIVSLVEQVTI